MRKAFKTWITAALFVMTFGGATLSVATPTPSYAACSERLLTFPAWYKGLLDSKCSVKSPASVGGTSNFIWKIVLNVTELMLQAVGYITVGFIIYGGFKYMISAGSPDGISNAKKTIQNAVIGLVISIFSVAIVNVIAGAF